MPAVAMSYYHAQKPARAVTRNKLSFDALDQTKLDTVIFIDRLKRVIQTKKEGEVLVSGTTPTYGMNVSGIMSMIKAEPSRASTVRNSSTVMTT